MLIFVNVSSFGCVLTTTWNGAFWSNGTPNTITTAIINAPYVVNGIAPTVNFDCCDLVVNSFLQIDNNRFVTYQGDLRGTGNILVKSGGKLIPINDTSTCSNPNITVERITSVLKRYDYVYFSPPTDSSLISQTLAVWNSDRTFTLDGTYFIDLQTNYQEVFVSNIPDGQDDFDPSPWILADFSSNFIAGLGYPSMIVDGNFPRTEVVSFTGCINTGIIQVPLKTSGNPVAMLYNPNIVGNPYSASILADSFIIDNLPNISGTLYFWTHTNTLSSSYSGLEQLNFNIQDYSSYNLSGGIASSFGGITPNGFIPSCQGFLVYSEIENSNVVFKPSYMAAGYPNSGNFYRFRDENLNAKLKLSFMDNVVTDGVYKQILINYDPNTSLQYDKGWDAKVPIPNQPLKFYTLGDYEIEARGGFVYGDVVQLGYSSYVSGQFKIQLDSMEGIENVYLLDNYLNISHNLSTPYVFSSETGTFNDRFELHYSETLNSTSIDKDDSLLMSIPNPTKDIINIYGLKSKPVKISLYNILGREIYIKNIYDNGMLTINLSDLSNGIYILKLENNKLKLIKE